VAGDVRETLYAGSHGPSGMVSTVIETFELRIQVAPSRTYGSGKAMHTEMEETSFGGSINFPDPEASACLLADAWVRGVE
jgi:hypothetical protein